MANLCEREPDVVALDDNFKERGKQIISVPEIVIGSALKSPLQRWSGLLSLLKQSLGLVWPALAQPLHSCEVQVHRGWRIKQKVRTESVGEEPLPGLLGRQDTPVDLHPYGHGGVLVANGIQLACGALVVTGKTEQLKEKNTLARIGWVRSHLLRQLLNSN